MSNPPRLDRSAALWNRSGFDLESDEILAQILDRGTLPEWRALYGLAARDARLRARIVRLCRTVPLSFPNLFIAAMAALGEPAEPWPSPPTGGHSGEI